ncbi:MAG: hypothetical protein JNN13_04715 [Planctomycetes bacterium]|nr:hypothetical protein [Planctomycetota bacterium]
MRDLLLSLGLGAAMVPAQALPDVVQGFAPFDLDGDGRAEVRSLEVLAEVGDPKSPLVVVLVERRLWSSSEAAARPALVAALHSNLRRFAGDVAAGGARVLLLAAEVHHGPPHQDGRTVLAMRRLFQRLHAVAPMQAAVLVGHFPDALLVRTCNWRRNEKLELPGKDGQPVAFAETTTNVRCVPEYVAHRCDLVLADLDGDWERRYVPGPVDLPSVTCVFGDAVPDAGGSCQAMRTGALRVVDVFHVRDGAAVPDAAAFAVRLDAADRDHECAAADRQLGNPMARPDIAVSRLDARGLAWWPELRALDVDATVGTVRVKGFDLAGDDKATAVQWEPNDAEELRLLNGYFDRNHSFRTRPLPAEQHKPASIAHGLGSGLNELRAASAAWGDFRADGYDLQDATLLDLLHWLQRPAVLRTLRAHSDGYFAAFARTDVDQLARELGTPWHWTRYGQRLSPSWSDHQGGRADFVFYRAVHDQKVLPDSPFLLLHTGCEALSPPHAVELAYDDPRYGRFAHAESLLFFTPCLAMLGRAKVFYDEPREFAAVLGQGGTIGDTWRHYFELESQAKDWNEVGGDIGRKRAYFWSIVGDCTLRLPR